MPPDEPFEPPGVAPLPGPRFGPLLPPVVGTPGIVSVNDEVHVRFWTPPGLLERAVSAASRSATKGVQRLLEATILRERD